MLQLAKIQHPTELPQTIAMLSHAFQQDPLWTHIYPDATERTRRLPLMFSIPLRYTLRYGEIITTAGRTGAICWLPPHNTTTSIKRLLSIGILTILPKADLPGLHRLNKAEDYMKSIHRRCISEPHWYLWILGVDPAQQRQGIGSTLLHAGLERVNASGLSCYLETTKPNNVTFYQKFGFAIASEGNLPNSNLHMWHMLRPGRTHLSSKAQKNAG